ncbi:MAG: hypothetical protein JHC81_01685 [Brevundimonas sp.]|uniref:hypothetical protein n=1 Tax=Brevundimonas sp. TaxID=1871086 RepID=UPI001A351D29|nr:hypothetical protein [Brevundimonas sp.]MBJ7446218.1 hypothetical protein [Brevundimonas sp.]
MAARLKVFTWSDGFHAFTIATTSRPKALDAWGSKQDLFASGLASELSGGSDYDAAIAAPDEVIERGLAVDIGKITKAKSRTTNSASKAKKRKQDALERRLADLDTAHAQTLADFDNQVADIERRRHETASEHDRERAALVNELKATRRKG